jgi:hypothetical protein
VASQSQSAGIVYRYTKYTIHYANQYTKATIVIINLHIGILAAAQPTASPMLL